MARGAQLLVLVVMLFSAASAQQVSSSSTGYHAKFVASNGNVIKLDTRAGTLDTPRTRSTDLQDCSDKFQVCLTDHHRFAFAYFRKCNDAVVENYKRLSFPPKVVSVLHNSDVWMVFDGAPNYLFHYSYSKGVVGIYIGRTASYDFRSVLRDPNFRVFDLDSTEYRIVGSDSVAACSP
jgi:hypothetical protein